jgi:hypothetical protein
VPLLIAIILGVCAIIASKAGMKRFAKFLGLIGIITFIYWLASGPGFTALDWLEDPKVDVPDVDINR